LLAAAAAAAGTLAAHPAQANPNQVIGLDMTPAPGGASASSGVDTCVQVAVGDSFEADVFATNLSSLVAYEFRVDFDPTILSLDKDAVDFNFLLAKDGGNAQFPVVDQERDGRWFIGAADAQHPDSGSGTLARITFKALKKGTSTLTIAADPTVFRPLLKGALGVSVGDDNGDGYWDGGLSSGKAAVGQSCSGSTPVVTPAPTHVPNDTPKPGAGSATPAQGDDQGGGSDNSGSGSGNSGSEPNESSPPIVGDIEPGGGDSNATGAPGNAQDPEDGSQDGSGGLGRAGSDGSSSSTIIVLAAAAAALAAAAGTVLLWLRTVSGRE
jgi:hypothetical protein